MTDELKQLAAEYQKRMSWLIDEPTNWTLFLEDFGREVQRQTVEACAHFAANCWTNISQQATAEAIAENMLRSLLSPAQEVRNG